MIRAAKLSFFASTAVQALSQNETGCIGNGVPQRRCDYSAPQYTIAEKIDSNGTLIDTVDVSPGDPDKARIWMIQITGCGLSIAGVDKRCVVGDNKNNNMMEEFFRIYCSSGLYDSSGRYDFTVTIAKNRSIDGAGISSLAIINGLDNQKITAAYCTPPSRLSREDITSIWGFCGLAAVILAAIAMCCIRPLDERLHDIEYPGSARLLAYMSITLGAVAGASFTFKPPSDHDLVVGKYTATASAGAFVASMLCLLLPSPTNSTSNNTVLSKITYLSLILLALLAGILSAVYSEKNKNFSEIAKLFAIATLISTTPHNIIMILYAPHTFKKLRQSFWNRRDEKEMTLFAKFEETHPNKFPDGFECSTTLSLMRHPTFGEINNGGLQTYERNVLENWDLRYPSTTTIGKDNETLRAAITEYRKKYSANKEVPSLLTNLYCPESKQLLLARTEVRADGLTYKETNPPKGLHRNFAVEKASLWYHENKNAPTTLPDETLSTKADPAFTPLLGV